MVFVYLTLELHDNDNWDDYGDNGNYVNDGDDAKDTGNANSEKLIMRVKIIEETDVIFLTVY